MINSHINQIGEIGSSNVYNSDCLFPSCGWISFTVTVIAAEIISSNLIIYTFHCVKKQSGDRAHSEHSSLYPVSQLHRINITSQ